MEDNTAPQPRKSWSVKIDATAPATRVVNKFGGLSAFCEATGFATSTVHSWQVRGLVPSRMMDTAEGRMSYQAWIMRCGKERGVEIDATDFIEQTAAA